MSNGSLSGGRVRLSIYYITPPFLVNSSWFSTNISTTTITTTTTTTTILTTVASLKVFDVVRFAQKRTLFLQFVQNYKNYSYILKGYMHLV